MDTKKAFLTLLACLIIAATLIIKFWPPKTAPTPPGSNISEITPRFNTFKTFATDQEFIDYMASSARGSVNYSGRAVMMDTKAPGMPLPVTGGGAAESSVDRVSETNTQVFGIDEPDIVKTDGTTIYYSRPYINDYPVKRIQPIMEKPLAPELLMQRVDPGLMPERNPEIISRGGISIFNTSPPGTISSKKTMNMSGDMLLSNNTLVVFNESNYAKRTVTGFDISNPQSPQTSWKIPLKENVTRVAARLLNDKLYLVTKTYPQSGHPCPIPMLDISGSRGFIPCREIHRPPMQVSADSVYTAYKINVDDGGIEDSVSFVGSSNKETVYMSKDALYTGYYYSGDMVKIMYGFVLENKDMFPATVSQKLAKLKDYDISEGSKLSELSMILSSYTSTFDEDKRVEFESNMQNRMKKFMKLHARELEKTGIVKINLDSFSVAATGDVPGKTLNQFALDEYRGNLRIATTVGQNSWFGQFGQLTQSFSDVYVLNGSLKQLGSVLDLGKTERIYSVRFIADQGYVVTFRQTDPLYVIDLSNGSDPKVTGELKIPGYSAYLHPLTETVLLGVGKEGQNVKLSLFDVSDPENPTELDSYILDEYWSEALDNHHAFLADDKHKAFFIPGSKGGYVFSYEGNQIAMKKAVSDEQVQRALYINNYLYVIGNSRIVVLNENNWTVVKELDL
ncbi:hypothetical protein COY90_03070 [Candidatus Roizmanbacteria bacterium CG_4_10_14_0_8_um_filter_39_9]|uniref:Beta propeller domain-containing protein n=1 Tax=Candidatus Roizmanbacteria bacterium CG_4_10_14_0_8_um_filter_39_9 TaxID=1974829 RepID=A0A2M7QCM4_9BACT|nr:MAG: hypothetical protein COY90_03070 [Candidatus Roizmanbacteria bacterium CG_4_10_14_0_8_um_filter_39_9]